MFKYLISIILIIFSINSYSYKLNKSKEIDNKLLLLQKVTRCKLYITSAKRSIKHNKRVGGASNSYHLKDLARDITINNRSCKYSYLQIGMLATSLFNGVIIYNNHIHIDFRKKKFHKIRKNKKYLDIF